MSAWERVLIFAAGWGIGSVIVNVLTFYMRFGRRRRCAPPPPVAPPLTYRDPQPMPPPSATRPSPQHNQDAPQ